MTHPCQYSPEVLDTIRPLISEGEWVHDPFAGTGLRLGALCDEVGAVFSGGDIEDWPDRDSRVNLLDALDPDSYPWPPFTIVTSPVYQNKRLADYANGPTPTTKVKGRRDYGIALGRALHEHNLARYTGRPSREGTYYLEHAKAVGHWDRRVVVNVDQPISLGWQNMLIARGYRIKNVFLVRTKRYGGLDNADKRAPFEVVIVGEK